MVRTQRHYPTLGTKESVMESNNSFYNVSFNVLRTLTIVKNEDGKPKIAHFGSTFVEDEPNCYEKQISFFKEFISCPNKMYSLLQGINKVQFFSEDEYIEYVKSIAMGDKKSIAYENEYLDSSVGVYIIDKCNKFNEKTRFVSNYKYINDVLFYSLGFEIDFQTKTAAIRQKGDVIFSYTFEIEKPTKRKKSPRGVAPLW